MDIDYVENEIGYKFPYKLKKIIELNLLDFDLWYLMNEKQIVDRFNGLKERYKDRDLIPFARRGDCDDIACFEREEGEKVFIIHDYSSSGYEKVKIFDDLWAWLTVAIEELIEYNIEEENFQREEASKKN